MDEQKAREILEGVIITEDDNLYSLGVWYLWWAHDRKEEAVLDGQYTADQLEAIAWWMRNK